MDAIPTATLFVSYTHLDQQEQQAFAALAKKLSRRLEQPVIPCPLDSPGNPMLNGVATALQQGAVRIVTLPLFLSPAEYRDNTVAKSITLASRRWPFVQFHLSPPPDWADWVTIVEALMVEASGDSTLSQPSPFDKLRTQPARRRSQNFPPSEGDRGGESLDQPRLSALEGKPGGPAPDKTVAILVGRGETDSDFNSDVAKLARLLYDANDFGWVDIAFTHQTTPSVIELLNRYQNLSIKHVIITPYLLFDGQAYQQLRSQIESYQRYSPFKIATTPSLSHSDNLIDVLLCQHAAALKDRSLLPVSWEEVERQLVAELNTHDKFRPGQPPPDEDAFQQLAAKIDAILPPRYKGRTADVSAAPMAAADLVFDDDGDVAWDQIFGVDDPNNPFCELALAGGPAHRGELLEPPLAADCSTAAGKYAAVLAEIERGIHMITGLPVVSSNAPGWIGVQCDSEAMAIWLMRAIIVENVMVRRERDVIYLPAGPDFTLKNEIKSIVTVTAKTWHYWIEHISYQTLLTAAKSSMNGKTA
ncbi:MAG: hypothetical protein KDJ65_00245 [Anaerolineae bacterium]|nr:hypothetical protein [Anaerolineae bacterium]